MEFKNNQWVYHNTILFFQKVNFWTKIIETNKLYEIGSNSYGQLCIGNQEKQLKPIEITFFKDLKIKNIFKGGLHTLILTGKFKIFKILENNLTSILRKYWQIIYMFILEHFFLSFFQTLWIILNSIY